MVARNGDGYNRGEFPALEGSDSFFFKEENHTFLLYMGLIFITDANFITSKKRVMNL